MREWDPEIEIDAERGRELIETQFPELRGAEVRELAAGWDNVVHLVDERWAFRFPRRAIAVPGVHREIAVLPRLAGHLPLPIPEPHFIGVATGGYPWPWFGARFIPGTELADSGLPDERRVELGASLGRFLRALHDPGLASSVGLSLPVDPNRRADMEFRVPATRRRLDEAATAGLCQMTDATERLLMAAAALPAPRAVVLHGDLHARHVVVDANGLPTGVIDWGDVCAGDPSVDLSFAYGSLTGGARVAFLDAYGHVDQPTEVRARIIATSLGVALLAYAADRGMEALRAESARALARAVD